MSKPHALVNEIKKWANAPDEWQWQIWVYPSGKWVNASFNSAMHKHLISNVTSSDADVRLVPKRSMIPAHLLPEGWEVERRSGGYLVRLPPTPGSVGRPLPECVSFSGAFGKFLRHIDPEANDE